MDFGLGDEGADAAAALNEALAFQKGKGVTRGHETDVMRFGEVALGWDSVAGLKLPGINAFADDALNALISRELAGDPLRKPPRHNEIFFSRRHSGAPAENERYSIVKIRNIYKSGG